MLRTQALPSVYWEPEDRFECQIGRVALAAVSVDPTDQLASGYRWKRLPLRDGIDLPNAIGGA